MSHPVDVEGITPALLTQALRAWQHGRPPPDALLALDLLDDDTAVSPAARAFALHDHVLALVAAELARLRAAEGLPAPLPRAPSRAAALEALRRDFRSGNAELQGWSALYYRFLCPLPISQEELAAAVPLDPRSLRRHANHGLDRLVAALQRQELAAHGRLQARARARHLPPPEYARLFGLDGHTARLAALLRRAGGPRLLSIEGLGGIGKTALGRAVAAALAQDSDFAGIAWISARQTWLSPGGEILPAAGAATTLADIATRLAAQLDLQAAAGLGTEEKLAHIAGRLRAAPHLIVIDNLETVEDTQTVLPALIALGGDGRFLLTSRRAAGDFPLVQRYPLPPLGRADSQALVESEMARHGRAALLTAAEMEALYDVIGGMPLALKLVAAQIGRWPLAALLDGLRGAAAGSPQALYTYIYRRTWLALNDDARRLLLAMLTISAAGEDISWLRLVSLLDDAHFEPALSALLAYSLLETAGPPAAPTYRLHRLTATFLQTEVLSDWQES